jgi:hypothetical protein
VHWFGYRPGAAAAARGILLAVEQVLRRLPAFVDEPGQQRERVLVRRPEEFRVPLDAVDTTGTVLDGFDETVGRACRRGQAGADGQNSLVMLAIPW